MGECPFYNQVLQCCYPSLAYIIAGIVLHVVTCTVPTCNCNCSLWVFVMFHSLCFSNCFRMSSTEFVLLYLSNGSKRYYLSVISVVFMSLLLLVISCPVFVMCTVYDLLLWLWSPFPTTVPWIHGPPSSH